MTVQIREFSGEELDDVTRKYLMLASARTDPDFHGRIAFQEMGGTVTLSRAHWGGPLQLFRTTRMATRAATDNLMILCIHTSGRSRIHKAGASKHHKHDRFIELAAGTGVLTEARSPYERVSSTETRCLTLRFPRELLALSAVEITEGCARSMDPAAPAMQMLSGYLNRLHKLSDDLTASQRLDAGRAAIDLLAMALRDVTPSVPGGTGPNEVLLDMMRTHVREHLADPHLRVAELARRHHVSTRQLYTVFELIGTTPGAYLREQRLLAARTMLSDPRYARSGISSIAGAVGILDLTTFERAFRRQYGTTPASWRRDHLHAGPLP